MQQQAAVVQQRAPAPAAPPPRQEIVLPEHAQGMARALRATLDKCRTGVTQKKVETIEGKLDPFYQGVADGSIDGGVVNQVERIAAMLYSGNHVQAAQEHKALAQVHGMDDVGQKITPLKSIISLVKQKVDKGQW